MKASDVWKRISLAKGDITHEAVDAIVNAANAELAGGGGVDGAIHRAAGPGLLDACRVLGGRPTGSARITPGYNLPARFVIHAVGPVYRGGQNGEPELLRSCYVESCRLAAENGCETVTFSAISCGVYGYPISEAARVSIRAVADWLRENELPRTVKWCLFDDRALHAYRDVFDEIRSD